MNQQATVVLYDHRDEHPSIAKLGMAEAVEVPLVGIEEFGFIWLKLAEQDQPGSSPGVLLGAR